MASFMKEFEHLEIQLDDIKSATNNFDESKVIGRGGFGKVYEGELSHSQCGEKSLVAIKRLDRRYGQGDPEFFKEIRMLSCYRHENLISLLGFCSQRGEMILVYEHASHGSLERYLSSSTLTWTQRLRICIDAAKGLSFLHDPNGTQQRVLHCDIKSANILLDNNMTAKVSDFGLSKMGPANQQYSLLITAALGTPGYCDPVFLETYTLTKESDVYSFGVVLFEILSGKLCVEIIRCELKVYVPFWKKSYEENKLNEIILQDLTQQMDPSSLKTFSDIAFQCLRKAREERPTMSRVVEELEIALESQEFPDLRLEVLSKYQDILMAVDPLLIYKTGNQLKELLSKGLIINEGKSWLSINEKGQHIERIYIQACLDRAEIEADDLQLPSLGIVNSRFPGGQCYNYCYGFEARVRAEYLSPQILYTVNLVFRYEYEPNVNSYKPLRYKFTSKRTTVDLLFEFEVRHMSLLVAGFEFRPLEEKVELQQYQDIVEVAVGSKSKIEQISTWMSSLSNAVSDEAVVFRIQLCLLSSVKDLSLYLYVLALSSAVCCDEILIRKDDKAIVACFCVLQLIEKTGNDSGNRSKKIKGNDSGNRSKNIDRQRFRESFQKGRNAMIRGHPETMRRDTNLIQGIKESIKRKDGGAPYRQSMTGEIKCCDAMRRFGAEQMKEDSDKELQQYQDIVEVASQFVFYKSLDELKQILSKGVHLNGYKTWFSLNEKGEHCHIISMKDCLIPNEDFPSRYESDFRSRFPAGLYQTNNKGFKTHVKTQFLSPSITYTVNLVLDSFSFGEQAYVDLKYRLKGETTTSTVYLANRRDDDMCHIVELYQFTSDGSIVDLEIDFDDHGTNLRVEGILFRPLEIVEDQGSKDDKVENFQTISDSESDTYWEQMFPNDYEEILNLSKESLMWTTKKELYSILIRGFMINNGQEWFTVDKHGKKCPMLSPRAVWVIDDKNSTCESSYESRFGEVLVVTAGDKFELVNEIKFEVLSADTTYATYFVYKLPLDQSRFKSPLEVNNKSGEYAQLFSKRMYSYLVSPPNTAVIGQKFEENSYNPLNRHKLSYLPRQRSDGWMEVKVWQFDTGKTPKTVSMHLKLEHPVKKDLSGLIIYGIELRPI
ncbi:kinase-like domain, phloem protein 2-like protein [Tanacetum coccineum]